jgi:hypothetical protein
MATMQCPACALTVPYYCCEGLVCPACGYDEAVDGRPAREASRDQAADAPTPDFSPAERPAPRRPMP